VAQASVPVSSDIDKRYYDHLISSVPPESHSVPLILHCLLEQVSACNLQVVKTLKSRKRVTLLPGTDILAFAK